jgi:riboflavin-specific deaminase-like protein
LRRFLPSAGTPSAEEAYADLGLAARAEGLGRPYVIANMVMTADGRATLGGRTKGLSSSADRTLFHALREQVDGVMAGTGTIALERYGPLVRDEARRQRRVERGLAEQPIAVTASRSLELPVDVPLFADPASRIVVLAGAEGNPPEAGAAVTIERVPGPDGRTLDLVAGLERLRRDHGVRTLLHEGGPTLLAAMLEAGLVDELFMAIAPLLVGGGPEPSILEGPQLPEAVSLRLLGLLEEESFLFLRYAVGA